jgi:hypothetical protein
MTNEPRLSTHRISVYQQGKNIAGECSCGMGTLSMGADESSRRSVESWRQKHQTEVVDQIATAARYVR